MNIFEHLHHTAIIFLWNEHLFRIGKAFQGVLATSGIFSPKCGNNSFSKEKAANRN